MKDSGVMEPAMKGIATPGVLSDAARLAAAAPAWLGSLRRAGLSAFQTQGLPSRRDEAWKYTDFARSGATAFTLAAYPDSAAVLDSPPPIGSGPALVFANGRLVAGPTAACPVGVSVGPFGLDALAQVGAVLATAGHAYVALNAALFDEGLLIRVAAGTRLDQPLELIWVGSSDDMPRQFHSRVLIVVESGAEATVVERHVGRGAYFSNQVVEIVLAEGSKLHHVVVQDQSSDSLHLSTFGVSLAAGARYESVVLQIGARLARHEVHATLTGDGAHLGIAGGALAGEGQHIDNSTRVVHAGLGSTSQQLFKTVLDGSGHGVFLGTVEVGEGAQKTDAQQLSRTLMLSDRAIMDAKPELLIFADDVKCSHGATVGDIDEQALFYMRSRGIDEATARQLLTEGFLVEVIDRIADGPTRDLCADLIAARLHKETA